MILTAIFNLLLGFGGTLLLWGIFSMIIIKAHEKEVTDEQRNQKGN